VGVSRTEKAWPGRDPPTEIRGCHTYFPRAVAPRRLFLFGSQASSLIRHSCNSDFVIHPRPASEGSYRRKPRVRLALPPKRVILGWKLIGALWHGICRAAARTGVRVASGDQELMAVLGGAVAVPCTCNPLQQG